MSKAGWHNQFPVAALLVSFSLITAACSTTNNNGNCDAQGKTNGVNCAGQTSAAASSLPAAGSPQSSPPSSPALVGYYLADFNPVQAYGINVDSTPRQINGVTYDHPVAWSASFSASDPYWAEWDLSRKCVSLTSPGVGVWDQASSGDRYIFQVLADGSYKWQKTISLGQSDSLKISIKGVLRLRLSVGGLQNGGNGDVGVWGNAQVWCYSKPPDSKN